MPKAIMIADNKIFFMVLFFLPLGTLFDCFG